MEVDLSDKNIYNLVERSDIKNNDSNDGSNNSSNNGNIIDKLVDIQIIKKYKKESSSSRFIRNLLIVILCIIIIYFTIFRYVIGYDFFKSKQYVKSAAVLSPEIITISSLLL